MSKVSTPLEIKFYLALKAIARGYMTPAQIRRDAPNVGLDYEEYLEGSYDNIQGLAERTIKGVRIKQP